MLDPLSRQEALGAIRRIHKGGATVIHVTHRLEEAADADRLVIMDSGRIVADGLPRNVFMEHDLERYGIEMPVMVTLSKMLARAGFSGRGLALTKEELLEDICQLR
jgi:energy-coupling factor transport system ATP-binding protein